MKKLILIALAMSTLAHADPSPETVRTILRSQLDAHLIRGTAITLISNSRTDQILVGDAKSESTVFEIGSVSKSFAGVALAELSLEHKLDLEHPIATYIPELSNSFMGTITAKQLATHLARLPRNFVDSMKKQTDVYTETELIGLLKNYAPDPVLFPAGKRQYSNLGFGTLALIITRIENRKYTDVIRERIFAPLGMQGSGFLTNPRAPEVLMQGYNVVLEPSPYSAFGDLESASGGIFSNLHDMTLYLKANLKPPSDKLGQALQLSHEFGLGWDSEPGAPIVWKNGATGAGFNSLLKFDPANGKGMIFLANELNVLPVSRIESAVFETPDPTAAFKDLASSPEAVKAAVGEYFTLDGKKQYKIFAVGENYLGIEPVLGFPPRKVPDAFYRFRLLQWNPGTFLINQGVGLENDVVKLSTSESTGQKQLLYIEYKGNDTSGEPIYERTLYFQKLSATK